MGKRLPPSTLTEEKWSALKSFTLDIYNNWQQETPEGQLHQHTHPAPFTRYIEQEKPNLSKALLKYSKISLLDAVKFVIRGREPTACYVCGMLMMRRRHRSTASCSVECKTINKVVKDRGRKTCLRRYGVDNYSKTEECVKKQRKAWAEKGGHWSTRAAKENPEGYSRSVREAQIRTNAVRRGQETKLARYGEAWGSYLAQRAVATMKERYGAHWFATTQGKEKARNGMLRKHGVSHPLQSEDFRRKRALTVQERYGGEPSGNPEVRRQIEETLVERYGKDHQKLRVRHIAESSLKRRGIRHPLVVSSRGLKQLTVQGKFFECYGYEPTAIQYLVKAKGVRASDIFTSREMLDAGALRLGDSYCYPDLWIGETPIEVKSLYTLIFTYRKLQRLAVKYSEYTVLVFSQYGYRIPFTRTELLSWDEGEAIENLRQRERELRDTQGKNQTHRRRNARTRNR